MALQQISHVAKNERMAECIDHCFEATQACEWCATECVERGDPDMARCIQLCRDVADIASLHARMMSRDSEFEADIAETCADLCEACADECSRFDHEHCQTCAEVVAACAESCRDMAGQRR